MDARSTYIRDHREIWEVILTGGDPLMLSPRRLSRSWLILPRSTRQDHRIHTRVPVADPRRVSADMVAALKVAGATCWLRCMPTMRGKLTDDARAACARLIDAGVPMVSQSVLLRGVQRSRIRAGRFDARFR